MALVFPTGETHTVVFELRGVSGNHSTWIYNGRDPLPPIPHAKANGQVFTAAPWADGSVTCAWTSSTQNRAIVDPETGLAEPSPDQFDVEAGLVFQLHPSLEPEQTVAILSTVTIPPDSGAQTSGGFSGSLTISVPCTVYAAFDVLDRTEQVYWPDPDDPNSVGFPITGGNSNPDSITGRKCQKFLVPTVGATVVGTATVEGQSVTQSFVWGGGGFYHGLYCYLLTDGAAATGSATADPVIDGVHQFEGCTHTYAFGDGHWSAAGSLSVSTSGPIESANRSDMAADGEIPSKYRIKAKVVTADGQAYPDALTVSYPGGSFPLASGEGTKEIRQRAFVVTDLYGAPEPINGESVSEKTWMTAALSQGPLEANGDDKRDWRLQWLTWLGGSLTFDHAASTPIVPAGSTGWSGGAAGGLGYVLSSGSATRTLGIEGSVDRRLWQGYRFASIQLKGHGFANRDVTITATNAEISKTFKVKTGADGAVVTPTFDTASPTNVPEGSTPTNRDAPYPLKPQVSHADGPIGSFEDDDTGSLDVVLDPDEDGGDEDALKRRQTWVWGLTTVDTLTIACDLGDGESLEIGAVTLSRQSPAYLSLIDTFKAQGLVSGDGVDAQQLWYTTVAGGRTTPIARFWGGPFANLDVDGRRIYSHPGNGYRTYEAGGYDWVFYSAADLAGWPNAIPGCSCVAAGTPNFYGLSPSSAYALCVGGVGGLTYDGSSFASWTRKALPQTVPVQDSYDWFAAYPGCVNPFGFGSEPVGGFCEIAVGKTLRSYASGIALQDDSSPNPGAPLVGSTVDLVAEDGGASWGAATTDARGSYLTGLPGGRGNDDGTTYLRPGSDLFETARFRNRYLSRTSFRGVRARGGKPFGVDVSRAGRWARAYGMGGTLRIGRAANYALPSAWDDVDTGLPADWARIRYPRVGQGDPLFALAGKDSSIALYRIDAEGAAPIMSHTIGSGQAGELLALDDGPLLAWRVQSGAVHLRRFRRDETEIGTEQATNLSGLDDGTSVAAGFYPDPRDGKRRIGLLHVVGGTLVLRLSDDGVTFA